MGKIHGERSVEVVATLERCYAIAADIEGAVAWQGSLRHVDVLERDDAGRAVVVETKNDAKVRTVSARLAFDYDEPTVIRWKQVKGDVKSLDGWWNLEPLDEQRTRATYGLAVDPGRMLGLLLRGPVEGQVREFLLGNAADGLKRTAEG